jgi:dethiobiotin synthetase
MTRQQNPRERGFSPEPGPGGAPEGENVAPAGVLDGVVLVTGTGTGVGKTTVTAALAARALAARRRVCVVKPVQTGVGPDEPGDTAEVARLLAGYAPGEADSRLELHEFFRLREPLAPQAASALAGVSLPPLAEHAERITKLAAGADLVLVEGAGGLLVRLDGADCAGGTIADLGALVARGLAAEGGEQALGAVVVTGAELGTLNLTELTVEALRHRCVPVLGLVIGSWPRRPDQVERLNARDLPALTGVPLLGAVPRSPAPPPPLVPAD